MNPSFIFLIIFSVIISSISQLLLKKSAMIPRSKRIKEYLNGHVIIAYGLLFVAMGITVYAFTVVPLKYGAVFETLSYAFVMVLSAIFLKEKMTFKKILGNFIIILGIILFNLEF